MSIQKFELVYKKPDSAVIKMGDLYFNGKFVFRLGDAISYEVWQKIGIIPVNPETREFESSDLFAYINSRLPIELRQASKEEKLKYIKNSGLKVPSDGFYFVSA